MPHHIRRIPDTELPQTEKDDGGVRAATPAELLNHGLQLIGTDPATGDGIYSVACVDPCRGHPGVEISSGALNERHQALPGELRPHVLRARVFRATDGSSLRERVALELRKTIAPRKPVNGETLIATRRLAADDREPVGGRTVVAADVEDGDVVERDDIYPMRWAGEISSR